MTFAGFDNARSKTLTGFARILLISGSLALAPFTASTQTREGVIDVSHNLAALHAYQVITKFALASYGKGDQEKLEAFAQIGAELERFATEPREVVAVDSQNELAQLERLYVHPELNLSQQLTLFKTKPAPYVIASPRNAEATQALDELLERRTELAGVKDSSNLRNLMNGPLARRLVVTSINDPSELHTLLQLLPSRTRLDFINSLHKGLGTALTKIDSIGQLIAGSKAVALPSPAWQRFFQIMLSEYFRNLELANKLDILSGLLDRPDATTDLERFEILMMNAGPQFQKLFQIYARERGFSEEIKAVFTRLEQSTRPVPWETARAIILSKRVPFQWVSIEEKPLGVGTMAQVHLAMIRYPDGRTAKVVVRFLKPGIRDRILADDRVLTKVAELIDRDTLLRAENFPLISPLMKEVENMALHEAEVPLTVAAQIHAREVYTRDVSLASRGLPGTIRFRVPGVIAEATDSDFMVQEFVPGTSFEKFAKVEPVLARVAAEEAAKLWLENALLTNGFFHSDLHQGNMRVQRVGNDVAVTLLDYGMTSQMTPKAQNQFLAFGLAMKSADAKLISRVLWELSIPEKNKITREQLEHTLAIEIVKRHGAEDLPFYEWPGIAMNAGIAFPSDFTAINRGFVLLIRMLEDMGSTMNLTGVMKTLVSKNPQKALAALNSVKAISKLDWAKFGFDKLTGTRVFNPPPHATLRCEALF